MERVVLGLLIVGKLQYRIDLQELKREGNGLSLFTDDFGGLNKVQSVVYKQGAATTTAAATTSTITTVAAKEGKEKGNVFKRRGVVCYAVNKRFQRLEFSIAKRGVVRGLDQP